MGYTYRGTVRDVVEEAPQRPVSPWKHKPFDQSKCGTYAGYKQHQNCGVAPCQPCKDAAAAYQRELKARHAAGLVKRVFRDDKCGTLAGYSRHKRHNHPVCDDCASARAEYRAAYYEKERAA